VYVSLFKLPLNGIRFLLICFTLAKLLKKNCVYTRMFFLSFFALLSLCSFQRTRTIRSLKNEQ
jgi:hypothetical protein